MRLSQKSSFICLILILLFAFTVRLIGLRFGFPYLLHGDEPTAVKRAVLFFRDGLNPRWFGMPSFYLYLLHFSYRLYNAAAALFGGDAALLQLSPEQTPLYFIGRLWTALLGTLTVCLVFLTGKRLYSRRTGLGAAFLLAVVPLHLLHSHYATVDVPVTFLIVLSFFFSAAVLTRKRTVCYLLAGGAAGVAAATKYNGAFAFFPLLAAHLLRERGEKRSILKRILDPSLLAGLAAALFAFSLATPYSLIEYRQFLADLRAQSHYLIFSGHGPIFIDTRPAAFYQIFYVLYYAGGGVFWIMALAGFLFALYRRRKADVLILSWVIPYFILISIPVVKFSRFFIPMLPFLSLWAGRLLEVRFARPLPGRLLRTVWLLGALWLGMQALAFTALLSRTDVRIEAKAWLEENIPTPARIGLIKTETGLIFLDDPPLDRSGTGLVVEQYARLLPALQSAPQYIIATDFDYRQILRLKERYDIKRCQLWREFLAGRLDYAKIKEFDRAPRLLWFRFGGSFPPHDMIYNRPRISIFRHK
ncbi:MAG: phospholipid carrier-dependent glycosyltransferase [PVC group bacterium]